MTLSEKHVDTVAQDDTLVASLLHLSLENLTIAVHYTAPMDDTVGKYVSFDAYW